MLNLLFRFFFSFSRFFFASFVALLWLMFEMFAHIICSVCVGMTCFIFCLAKGHFLTRVSCFVFFICHVSEVKSREHMHVSYAYMLYLKITPICQFFFFYFRLHISKELLKWRTDEPYEDEYSSMTFCIYIIIITTRLHLNMKFGRYKQPHVTLWMTCNWWNRPSVEY